MGVASSKFSNALKNCKPHLQKLASSIKSQCPFIAALISILSTHSNFPPLYDPVACDFLISSLSAFLHDKITEKRKRNGI